MTAYERLLRLHEAERARAVEALLVAVFDQLRPGVAAWRATVAALRGVTDDLLLVALIAAGRFPEFVAVAGAEAVLLAGLAALGGL